MTIETKYNIGDEVWFEAAGDAKCEEIFGIEVNVYKDKLFIEYLFANDSYPFGLNEFDLFPTKEELLKYGTETEIKFMDTQRTMAKEKRERQ